MCPYQYVLSFDGIHVLMDLPSGRKFLRFGKLKSNFFKEFSQNQCIYAHTLQDPVPTVDLRTSKMKQRNTMYTH